MGAALVAAVRSRIKIQNPLLMVGSKSGETTETLTPLAYFWDQVEKGSSPLVGRSAAQPRGGAGSQFAAITDAGTSLEKLAKDHAFRWVFPNPPDIGGRYSALSYFGLVPGALMGVNVIELLERAIEMESSCA